jgi:putative ABC transport system permease protein
MGRLENLPYRRSQLPNWKDEIKARLADLNLTSAREAQIVEELAQHLEDHYNELLAGGATPEEAYRASLVELSASRLSTRTLKEAEIKRDSKVFIGGFWQDLRYGVRMLRKNPGFASITVLILALGIGANTAIFSVVNAVLLRPLPYPESERMMVLKRGLPGGESGVSGTTFLFWREHNRTFESMAATDIGGSYVNLTDGDKPERLLNVHVSADFFKAHGISPSLGRSFNAEEERPGGDRVVIVSEGLWKRRFGGDPGLLGNELKLGGESYTVIGIMPPGFYGEIWMPLRLVAHDQDKAYPLIVIGRRKQGATEQQAQADMDAVARAFSLQYPRLMDDGEGVRVFDYHDLTVQDVRTSLLILLGAVVFVLLIACANVAGLSLARVAARQKEVAIRSALGAGRFRLVRQSLTESALLAVVGGILGLLMARWTLDALIAIDPGNIPRLSEVKMDGRALVFTLAVALSTGILFGLAPAFQLARVNLSSVLNESSGRASAGIRRSRLRSLLVVMEIGLSSMLLVGAALLIQTFANLRGIDPGFDPRNVLNLKVSLPETEYKNTAQMSDFFDRALQRIESVPGVEAAAVVTRVPLGSNGLVLSFSAEGMQSVQYAYWDMVTPDYFRALNIPLRRGRYFSEGDSRSSPAVALINETLARRYFPNKDPIGQLLTVGKIEGPDFAEPPRQIVGVVGDVRDELKTEAPAAVYVPNTQAPDGAMRLFNRILPVNFVIRTSVDPLSLAAAVQQEILAVDRRRAIFGVRSLEQVTADSISSQRFQMLLLGIFAAVALLLAAIGLYGVISYSVRQRTEEIGIRMALGARPRDILKLIVGQGLILTLLGLALGLTGASALTRLLAGLLFGVKATDPATFAAIALVLASVALLASYIPARRAMKIDPLIALRRE